VTVVVGRDRAATATGRAPRATAGHWRCCGSGEQATVDSPFRSRAGGGGGGGVITGGGGSCGGEGRCGNFLKKIELLFKKREK
jgi:hypothetical protein